MTTDSCEKLKDAKRDLLHIGAHLDKSGAPDTVINRLASVSEYLASVSGAEVPQVLTDEKAAFEHWAEHVGRVAYRDDRHGLCFYNGESKSYWFGWEARAKVATPTPTSSEAAPTDRDAVLEEAVRAVEPSWGPAAASKVRSLKGGAAQVSNALYEAAVNAEYPIPDSPHTSVVERAVANREAFRRGWLASKGKASSEAAAPDLSAWVSVDERLPEARQIVLVISESWEFPAVLKYQEQPYQRFIDEVTGRWYWYPERMRWMPLPAISKSPTSLAGSGEKPLTQCAADRDGECYHAQCPQLRDHEPLSSGRHCPLDNNKD